MPRAELLIVVMTLSRETAQQKVLEWTRDPSLLRHMRSVELVMRAAAHRYGGGEADVERWGIAGLLHDADYECFPDEHPRRIVAWLEDAGEAEIAHAVACHYTKWGGSHDTAMDKALLACDELTGFIIACCRVRPDGIATLAPPSVMKKLKDRSFAAKVDREEIAAGCQMLGAALADHIQFVISALRPHAAELGIAASRP
jgi:predicted hydrolase (HD superfamily)